MSAWFQVALHSNSNVYLTLWHGVYVQGGLVSKSEMKGAKNLILFFFHPAFFTACWLRKMLKDQPLKVPAAHLGRDGATCHPSAGAVTNCNLTASTPRPQCSLPRPVFGFLKIPNIPTVGAPPEPTQAGSWPILPACGCLLTRADGTGRWSPGQSSIHAVG